MIHPMYKYNHNKFYRITVRENSSSHGEQWEIFTEWGRIGKTAQSKVYGMYDRLGDAKYFAQVLKDSKIRKGYSTVAHEGDYWKYSWETTP